jgi:hypothetical protein
MPEPDSREPWFLCEAHTDGNYADRIISIFSDALDAALEGRAKHVPEPHLGDVARARVDTED